MGSTSTGRSQAASQRPPLTPPALPCSTPQPLNVSPSSLLTKHDEFYGLIFVMVDYKGGTLEGSIPLSKMAKFKDKIEEGLVYTIERFDVVKAREKYRAVDHPWRLCFTQTVTEPIVPQPENFPMFAYTVLPFSQLEKRVKENVLMSDVVGFVTSITEVLPPSGGAREQRRQVYISDGRQRAVVTLWGNLADTFDGSRLLEWSKDEPIVAMFVATLVDQYSGILAFKSTSATRWYINIAAPEVSAILESTKIMPYQIELQKMGQNQREPIETTIAALAELEPTDMMDEIYKLRIQVTEVVSGEDWWYMSCKECWKKLKKENDVYRCPTCSSPKLLPRYKILLHAIDVQHDGVAEPKFAEFSFFGQQGEIITGKDPSFLVAHTRGQAGRIPSELSGLVGKRFTVTVSTSSKSLDGDYNYFQVKATEPLREISPPIFLLLSTSSTVQKDGQCSSSEAASTNIPQGALNATPPPIGSESGKNTSSPSVTYEVNAIVSSSLLSCFDLRRYVNNYQETNDTNTSLGQKRPTMEDSLNQTKSNRRHAAKELFPPRDQKESEKK